MWKEIGGVDMKVTFKKKDWSMMYVSSYALDIYVPQNVDLGNSVYWIESHGQPIFCKTVRIADNIFRIMYNTPFDGNLFIENMKSLEEGVGLDKLDKIKNEIAEYDKSIEEMHKNNSINSNAYYMMKGFNVILSNIITK